jgi:subtilisin family serine protease
MLVSLALAQPALAAPGKIAIGIAPEATASEVGSAVTEAIGVPVDASLEAMGALVATVLDVRPALQAVASLPGVAWVEPVTRSRRLAFTPNDSYSFFQWYLAAIHAFDFWETRPQLPAVRVAVIDSGIDATHQDLTGRVAAGKSFVKKTSWRTDEFGHGTVVAGEIGATTDNSYGIAGVAFPAQLFVAKVVRKDGSISIKDEADAIHWAVDSGAEVINLSLGGERYSALEQAAVDYAYANGAVVVAAAGNCPLDPEKSCPEQHASYPAALPHVLGVGAIDQTGKAPDFSDRDPIYVDLAAPGIQILSTYPVAFTDPACSQPGFNSCALPQYRICDCGTSFAAPLASAAAALLRAQAPGLVASQVLTLLEGSATDLGSPGRDSATGYGRLDVLQALIDATAKPLPPADSFEASGGLTTNDDVPGAPRLYGSKPNVRATVDWYDDPEDVYAVYLRAGKRVTLKLSGPEGTKPTVALWRPSTKHITPITAIAKRAGFVLAYRQAVDPQISMRVSNSGWYYADVKAPKGGRGQYVLTVRKQA